MGAAKHLRGVRPIPAGVCLRWELQETNVRGLGDKAVQDTIKRFEEGNASASDVREALGMERFPVPLVAMPANPNAVFVLMGAR